MRKIYSVILFGLVLALSACEKESDRVLTISADPDPVGLGATMTIRAEYGSDAVEGKNLQWSSSDAAVATVSKGVVKGVTEGATTITATDGTSTAACEVTVRRYSVVGTWMAEAPSGRLAMTFNKQNEYTIIIENESNEFGSYSELGTMLSMTPKRVDGAPVGDDVRTRSVPCVVGAKTLVIANADIFWNGNPHDLEFPLTLKSAI